MADRRPIVVGNWKMNTTAAAGAELATAIADGLGDLGSSVDVGVCPPLVYVAGVADALCKKSVESVSVGTQNCYFEESGAFTGEVSTSMVKDAGAKLVLVGHSERRHVIGETDDIINKKVKAVLAADLMCILCIGETLEQREAGQTDAVNEQQLRDGLAGITAGQTANLVVAYEPVWAIGTGKTATPQDAQDAHAKCRAVLVDLFGAEAADAIRIQYGGSMKPENASELIAQPDIDGGLIGGASLKPESFIGIIQAAASAVATA